MQAKELTVPLNGRDGYHTTFLGKKCCILHHGNLFTPRVPASTEGSRIMLQLFAIHAEMLFEHGIANADPHAGNIMVMDDGRLGALFIMGRRCRQACCKLQC